MLRTKKGLRFIDFETCCRGPVEFDLSYVPEEVSVLYRSTDQQLLRECRVLMLAMVAAWRWDRNDQFPNGRQAAREIRQRAPCGTVGRTLLDALAALD